MFLSFKRRSRMPLSSSLRYKGLAGAHWDVSGGGADGWSFLSDASTSGQSVSWMPSESMCFTALESAPSSTRARTCSTKSSLLRRSTLSCAVGTALSAFRARFLFGAPSWVGLAVPSVQSSGPSPRPNRSILSRSLRKWRLFFSFPPLCGASRVHLGRAKTSQRVSWEGAARKALREDIRTPANAARAALGM